MTDSFTPDGGQRIDAQGRVTYDFTGHIHAAGLDLDAVGTGLTKDGPDDSRVRWIDVGNGAVVADLVAGGNGDLLVSGYGDDASVTIGSTSPTRFGQLVAGAGQGVQNFTDAGAAAAASVSAEDGAATRLVVDSLDRSSFVAAGAGTTPRRVGIYNPPDGIHFDFAAGDNYVEDVEVDLDGYAFGAFDWWTLSGYISGAAPGSQWSDAVTWSCLGTGFPPYGGHGLRFSFRADGAGGDARGDFFFTVIGSRHDLVGP